MVRLFGIAIARKGMISIVIWNIYFIVFEENGKAIKIAEEVDVSTFGFFQRNSVGEFIRFTHTVVLG